VGDDSRSSRSLPQERRSRPVLFEHRRLTSPEQDRPHSGEQRAEDNVNVTTVATRTKDTHGY
jgi:hypothetical protein